MMFHLKNEKSILSLLSIAFTGLLPETSLFAILPGAAGVAAFETNFTIVAFLFEVGGRFECTWEVSCQSYYNSSKFYYQSENVDPSRCSYPYSMFNQSIKFYITCSQLSSGIVATQLIFLKPFPAEKVYASLRCENDTRMSAHTQDPIKLNCQNDLFMSNISITPGSQASRKYSTYGCYDGSILRTFDGNGTLNSSVPSSCISDRFCRNQNNLLYWKVPNATVSKPPLVKAGTSADLSCNYKDEFPVGYRSRYFIGDDSYFFAKRQTFVTRILNSSDLHKPISCQPVTPLTLHDEDFGRSPSYPLDIQFLPYQSTPKVTLCEWVINKTGICDVEFSSNPVASFVSLSKCGNRILSNESRSWNLSGTVPQQTFQYKKYNVTKEDNGTYALLLRSPDLSFNFSTDEVTVYFRIRLSTSGPPNLDTTTVYLNSFTTGTIDVRLAAGLSAAGLFLLVVLMILVWRCLSKQKGQKENQVFDSLHPSAAYSKKDSEASKNNQEGKEEKANPLYAPSTSEQTAEVEVAFAEVNESKAKKKELESKEGQANLLYSPSTSEQPTEVEVAFAEVNENKAKQKKAEGKEEKANLLYSPLTSEQPAKVEATYSEVNKNKPKKKKSIVKEVKANPLYSPSTSEQTAEVEVACAEVNKNSAP